MKIAQTARRIGADIRDFVAALVILAGTAGIIWLYAAAPRSNAQARMSAYEKAGFQVKFGAMFVDEVNDLQTSFYFLPNMPWPQYTFQVPRAEFDTILLDHARARGVDVYQPATVEGADFDADGVTVTAFADGARSKLRAAVLVDASGRASFLASRLGLTASELEPLTRAFASPFDYESQSLLALPTDLPVPNRDAERHADAVARLIIDVAEASDGHVRYSWRGLFFIWFQFLRDLVRLS